MSQSAKVLIADESQFFKTVMKETLEKAGLEIVGEAETGSEAFGLYCTLKPDLLAMDPGLTEADGLIAEIRKKDPKTKILFVSTAGRHPVDTELMRSGTLGMIMKPFQPQELVQAVQALLGPEAARVRTGQAPKSPAPARVNEFENFRILVVDDEPMIVRALEAFLLKERFLVAKAGNGREALDRAASDKPHLVVTDIIMPEMDGLEMIEKLRQNPQTASIPIVILSQKTAVADRLKGFESGSDDYLCKPFCPEEMIFRIKAVLRRVYKNK